MLCCWVFGKEDGLDGLRNSEEGRRRRRDGVRGDEDARGGCRDWCEGRYACAHCEDE